MSGAKEKLEKIAVKVDVEKSAEIEEYLQIQSFEESNHNVINMMIWLEKFPLFYIKNERYMLLFGIYDQEMFMYMPLCEDQFLKEAIDHAHQVFEEVEEPVLFSCFTKEMAEKVMSLYPVYASEVVSGSSDYIYSAKKLSSMSGKKLQKKRNHINAFQKEYQGRYEYETLNEQNIEECLNFLNCWKEESDDEFLQQERLGAQRILQSFGKIPYRGGCIRVDGVVQGFAIGSLLSPIMVQENIEKANREIRGLYPMLLKEFLTQEFSEVEWINREDDMDYENLKKAKQAFYPEWMVDKFRLWIKEENHD